MRFVTAILAVAACFAVASATATTGVDVSQLFGVSAWQCVRNYGYKFAIVRCFCSTGTPDHNCAQSVANAWSGGMDHVDIYMFPCPQCGNAKSQVQTLYNHTKNIKYGVMWLDIEGSQYWLGSNSKNREFMNELGNAAKSIFGSKFGGIYTNKHQWSTIMGDWDAWSHVPLWWCYYDNSPSWSNWSPFGGWSKPAIKQYSGTSNFCGMSVDKNFYSSDPVCTGVVKDEKNHRAYEFNLSSLHHDDTTYVDIFWYRAGNIIYYMNFCGQTASACDTDDTSVCIRIPDGDFFKYVSGGSTSTQTISIAEDPDQSPSSSVTVTYSNGVKCGNGYYKTKIYVNCEQTANPGYFYDIDQPNECEAILYMWSAAGCGKEVPYF